MKLMAVILTAVHIGGWDSKDEVVGNVGRKRVDNIASESALPPCLDYIDWIIYQIEDPQSTLSNSGSSAGCVGSSFSTIFHDVWL